MTTAENGGTNLRLPGATSKCAKTRRLKGNNGGESKMTTPENSGTNIGLRRSATRITIDANHNRSESTRNWKEIEKPEGLK